MKVIALAVLVACVAADVSHILSKTSDDARAAITKQELDVGPDGTYQWAFETENGIAAHAHGDLKNVNNEPVLTAAGAAGWISPEGEKIDFTYSADENGYQPQGSHLPTPPPIPEAIIRALEYIRAHPPPPERK